MFARAAIVGRVARERSEARRHFLQQKQELKKKQPQAPLRQRCFIPLLRGPCVTVTMGCFLFIVGAIMCNFAFHAKDFSSSTVLPSNYNTTATEIVIDKPKFEALKSLTFIGPSLMGLGIFIIIIACVLLLDKRDKILKEYTDSILRTQQDFSMELSFRAATSDELRTLSKNSLKGSTTISEASERLHEVKSSDRMVRKVSESSLQCGQSFHSAMHGTKEIVPVQEIELAALHEYGKLDNSRASTMSAVACDKEPHPTLEEHQNLIPKSVEVSIG